MDGKIRKSIIIYLTLCMTILYSIPISAAKKPEFRIDMDTLNLEKGVSCNIVVSMINAEDAEIVSIEGLENFDVLSQSQSTSTSIINNDVSKQVDMRYVVMPKVTGEFTLKAIITYNGQVFTTNQLEVIVSEESKVDGNTASDLFVKTVVSHEDTAYLGEKIVVTYELYSRYSIDSAGFTDYLTIDGVVVKEMPEDSMKAEYVYIDGNRYVMYEVKQMIIDPMKAGVCTIPSFNLQVNVITDSGGGFGFFNSTSQQYLQTEEIELLINPLPTQGKPTDFSGVVGELELHGNYTRTELNYGDSLSLQIEALGNCNLDGVKNIVSEIKGFTVYETQKNTVESVEDNGYNVQKTYEAILIPEETGTLNIEPISISYFNPVSGKYETVQIQGETIEVLGSMPQVNENNNVQESAVERVIINQVNYADVNDGYFLIQIKKEWVYVLAIAIVIIVSVIVFLRWLLFTRKKKNPVLKSLYKKIMKAKDVNEIYNLFNDMIKNCYGLNIKASSQDYIRSKLADAELAVKVVDVMNFVESDRRDDKRGDVYLKDIIKNIYVSSL